MSFAHEMTVRFSQVDPAQVVYFAHVYEIAHEAFEELMAASGLAIGPLLGRAIGACLWFILRPAIAVRRLGERIRIEGTVTKVSERSVK